MNSKSLIIIYKYPIVYKYYYLYALKEELIKLALIRGNDNQKIF